MLKFNKDEVREKLHKEYGFAEDKIERGIDILLELDDSLQPLLDQWLKDGMIPNQKINGVSLDMIYKLYEVNDILSALICMEMFAEDEEIAKDFLRDPFYFTARK
ncbi:hypothetical protein [Hazenella coriacea]|uniref:Uncharacterized protein n=1 Tax=Hazenella coriacea TaxID=1179467 RepID=A0A4R3L9B4_9BACL|nr:hypothetical protein [Hazenella coriacea]TCS94814.1 hypothetical protein EDD58_103236 [Hazenella coriacea]